MVICTDIGETIVEALKPREKKRSHPRIFFGLGPLLSRDDEEIIRDGWVVVQGEKMFARFKLGGFLCIRWNGLIDKEHD